jgi:hypothetical protein
MTKAMLASDGPSTVASTMARGRNGITRNQSVTRIRAESVQRPKWPATMPTTEPMTTEITVARNPTVSDTRDPQRVRASTERPLSSVPSGKAALGGENGVPVALVTSSSLAGTNSGTNTATATNTTRMPSPIMPSQLRRYSRQARPAAWRRRARAMARGLSWGGRLGGSNSTWAISRPSRGGRGRRRGDPRSRWPGSRPR